MRVPAFGHPRIEAYLQLPAAFRSLSRPSSAPNAKAFSICSSSLELPSVYYLHNIGCSLLAWIAVIILYSYLSFWFRISRFSKIVSFTCFIQITFVIYGKTWFLNFLIYLVSLYFCLSCMKTNFFVSFIRFSMNIVLNLTFIKFFSHSISRLNPWRTQWTDGLKWTRTTDLVLIRHAL